MFSRIEFMGLPGSGKTTCCSVLLNTLRREHPGIRDAKSALLDGIRRRDDGLIRNVAKRLPFSVWEPLSGIRNAMAELHRFSCDYAPLMAHVFNCLTDQQVSASFRECIAYDFFRMAAEHQIIHEQSIANPMVVFEEGFNQVGCLLLGYLPSGQISSPAFSRYVNTLPPLFAVVWVDTDPEICLSRLERRQRMTIGLVGESRTRQMALLRQSKRGFERMADELSDVGVRVHRLQNNDLSEADMQVTMERIAAAMSAQPEKEPGT